MHSSREAASIGRCAIRPRCTPIGLIPKRAPFAQEAAKTLSRHFTPLIEYLRDTRTRLERIAIELPFMAMLLTTRGRQDLPLSLGSAGEISPGKIQAFPQQSAYNFLSFVAAAFVSIGGDPKAKWERTIRQILHDRPKPAEWDSFDRYEHDRLPPGTRFVDARERNKQLDRMREQALQDARAIQALVANRGARSS
jgi:hypothetical protein